MFLVTHCKFSKLVLQQRQVDLELLEGVLRQMSIFTGHQCQGGMLGGELEWREQSPTRPYNYSFDSDIVQEKQIPPS